MGRRKTPSIGNGPAAQLAITLSKARESSGLTIRELAERIGYSPSTLASAEGGRLAPSRTVTEAFLSGCGASAAEWRSLWAAAKAGQAVDPLDSVTSDGWAPAQLPSGTLRFIGRSGRQWKVPSTLAISLLGPLEIRRGTVTIQVPQNKHRVVIAVLALRIGTVVSVDDLITYLWTDQPPATAKKTLQGYVARIRKLLGRDVVTTHPSGYALTTACVDVVIFEQLLDLAKSESDQNRRLARLREALTLVRGAPLADIWSERLQQGPGASLTARWLEAIEHRIDSEIETGNHESVLPELYELLAAHPLREPFWRQFMYALYRADQQAEALNAFHRMRDMLIKELGVEPSPSVRALHAQILAHDPVLMENPNSRAHDLLVERMICMAARTASKLTAWTTRPPRSQGRVLARDGRLSRCGPTKLRDGFRDRQSGLCPDDPGHLAGADHRGRRPDGRRRRVTLARPRTRPRVAVDRRL